MGELYPACNQRVAGTFSSCSSGTTNPVYVIFQLLRNVVVEDRIHIFHVDAPCRHVGGDQQADPAGFEISHDGIPLILLHISVKSGAAVAEVAEDGGKFVHHTLGVAEDQCPARGRGFQQQAERIVFLILWNIIEALIDLCCRAFSLICFDKDCLGLKFFSDLDDFRGQGGAEQDGLAFCGSVSEDGPDIVDKSHIQHLVRFVQNHRFQVVEFQCPAAHVVHHTAGGSHDDTSFFQRADLIVHGLAAVNAGDADAWKIFCVFPDFSGDLQSQLAGRCKDQHTGTVFVLRGSLDDRNTESGCFTGSGAGTSGDVLAFQDGGNGTCLNISGLFVSHFRYGAENFAS